MQYDVVTLAAFSGSSIQWDNFEKLWKHLRLRHGVEYLHTTDAIKLVREFDEKKGWTETKVEAFIDDCVSVIELCAATRKGRKITHGGIRPATVTVILNDFKKALIKVADLGSVEHTCAIQCAGFCLGYGLSQGYEKFQFFFDQGERFYGHISDRVT